MLDLDVAERHGKRHLDVPLGRQADQLDDPKRDVTTFPESCNISLHIARPHLGGCGNIPGIL